MYETNNLQMASCPSNRSGKEKKQVMSRYPRANDMWPFTKKTTYVFYSLVNAEEKYLILEKA